jgi:hypothetical protein
VIIGIKPAFGQPWRFGSHIKQTGDCFSATRLSNGDDDWPFDFPVGCVL